MAKGPIKRARLSPCGAPHSRWYDCLSSLQSTDPPLRGPSRRRLHRHSLARLTHCRGDKLKTRILKICLTADFRIEAIMAQPNPIGPAGCTLKLAFCTRMPPPPSRKGFLLRFIAAVRCKSRQKRSATEPMSSSTRVRDRLTASSYRLCSAGVIPANTPQSIPPARSGGEWGGEYGERASVLPGRARQA